jgi:hypothetical protein
VQGLIHALEEYQRSRQIRLAQCVSLAATPTTYPSGFSRSQI